MYRVARATGKISFRELKSNVQVTSRAFSGAFPELPSVYGKGGKVNEIPSVFDQATGLERLELLAGLEGIELFNRDPVQMQKGDGTFENPVLIPSQLKTRTVGIVPKGHDLPVWFNITRNGTWYVRKVDLYFKLYDPLEIGARVNHFLEEKKIDKKACSKEELEKAINDFDGILKKEHDEWAAKVKIKAESVNFFKAVEKAFTNYFFKKLGLVRHDPRDRMPVEVEDAIEDYYFEKLTITEKEFEEELKQSIAAKGLNQKTIGEEALEAEKAELKAKQDQEKKDKHKRWIEEVHKIFESKGIDRLTCYQEDYEDVVEEYWLEIFTEDHKKHPTLAALA